MYCTKCGKETVVGDVISYDSVTGLRYYSVNCPNYRWYKPWHSHHGIHIESNFVNAITKVKITKSKRK